MVLCIAAGAREDPGLCEGDSSRGAFTRTATEACAGSSCLQCIWTGQSSSSKVQGRGAYPAEGKALISPHDMRLLHPALSLSHMILMHRWLACPVSKRTPCHCMLHISCPPVARYHRRLQQLRRKQLRRGNEPGTGRPQPQWSSASASTRGLQTCTSASPMSGASRHFRRALLRYSMVSTLAFAPCQEIHPAACNHACTACSCLVDL